MASMSALQLLLEMRSRQQIAAYQDEYLRQRSQLLLNTSLLRDPTNGGFMNQLVPLEDTAAMLSLMASTQTRSSPSISIDTNGNINQFTTAAASTPTLWTGPTKKASILFNPNALAASYAPVRVKRYTYQGKDKKTMSESKQKTDNGEEVNEKKKKSKLKQAEWLESYNALKEFKECHGHCIVPRNYKVTTLVSWVSQQRRQFRVFQDCVASGNSCINQERIHLLNELDFIWDAQEASWDRQMDELRTYHSKHGTCEVSRSDPDCCKLYRWAREQRRVHRDKNEKGLVGGLSENRINSLKNIGFTFDSVSITFATRLEELIEFHSNHNHHEVPCENSILYEWVKRIRKEYQMMLDGKGCLLRNRHIQALNKIEFPWTTTNEGEDNNSGNDEDDESACLSDSTATAVSALLVLSSSSSSDLTLDQDKPVLENTARSDIVRPFKKRRISF